MYVTAVCLTLCSLSISAVANGSCLGGLGVSVLCFVSLFLFPPYRFLFLVVLGPARRARCIASASQRLIPSAAAADAAAVTVSVRGLPGPLPPVGGWHREIRCWAGTAADRAPTWPCHRQAGAARHGGLRRRHDLDYQDGRVRHG